MQDNPFADLIPGQPQAQPHGPVYGAPVIPKPRDPLDDQYKQGQIAQQGLERQKTLRDLAKPPKSKDDTKGDAKLANMESVTAQVNRVQELYDKNLRGQKLSSLFGLTEYLPTPTNQQFDSAAAGLADQGMAAFKVPGMGPQSDQDAARFAKANQPSASDYDASIEEKLRQMRARIDANRKAMGLPPAQWKGEGITQAKKPAAAPSVGAVQGGYRFKGGNPADPKSWVKVK